MRLAELDPRWTFAIDDLHRHERPDLTIDTANGVRFACPKCYIRRGNTLVGVHSIICWNPTVPQTVSPAPGRWNMVGSSFEDLSLVAGSSSVHLPEGCGAHFLVTSGDISWCEPPE